MICFIQSDLWKTEGLVVILSLIHISEPTRH